MLLQILSLLAQYYVNCRHQMEAGYGLSTTVLWVYLHHNHYSDLFDYDPDLFVLLEVSDDTLFTQ